MKRFTYNHKLSHLYWLNCSLQKQLSVGFNKLHRFKMIVKRYVQKITKDSPLFCHTFLKSVLYVASSDPESSSSRMAATLRLIVWYWTAGLQMIKEHPKKYSINLHFMERTDSLKTFTLKLLYPDELIQVNKKKLEPFLVSAHLN